MLDIVAIRSSTLATVKMYDDIYSLHRGYTKYVLYLLKMCVPNYINDKFKSPIALILEYKYEVDHLRNFTIFSRQTWGKIKLIYCLCVVRRFRSVHSFFI